MAVIRNSGETDDRYFNDRWVSAYSWMEQDFDLHFCFCCFCEWSVESWHKLSHNCHRQDWTVILSYMPSYLSRRGIAPSKVKETLEEVKARIRKEVQDRTEERVKYWNNLAVWCRAKPGRYIAIGWNSSITLPVIEESICVEGPHWNRVIQPCG